MSSESWIGLGAILVTLALAGTSAVFCIMGWFLSRLIADKDRLLSQQGREIDGIQRELVRVGHRQTVVETILSDHGYMLPKTVRYPSPPPNIEETGSC